LLITTTPAKAVKASKSAKTLLMARLLLRLNSSAISLAFYATFSSIASGEI
jgi:hypothetical protein